MKNPRTLLAGLLGLLVAGVWGEAMTQRAAPTPPTEAVVTLPDLVYPLALLHKGITEGEVHLLLKISPDARLIDTLVTSYSRKELADFTLETLERAKFQPLRENERPVTTVVGFIMRFESRGMIVIERHAADRVDDTHPALLTYEPCDPRRLDKPLEAITVVSPAYSRELGQQGAIGSVVLDYYVDESGRVRMPVIRQSEHQALAGLSLAAIEQWQFKPPVSRNKPVLVRVQQKFEFVPDNKG